MESISEILENPYINTSVILAYLTDTAKSSSFMSADCKTEGRPSSFFNNLISMLQQHRTLSCTMTNFLIATIQTLSSY